MGGAFSRAADRRLADREVTEFISGVSFTLGFVLRCARPARGLSVLARKKAGSRPAGLGSASVGRAAAVYALNTDSCCTIQRS